MINRVCTQRHTTCLETQLEALQQPDRGALLSSQRTAVSSAFILDSGQVSGINAVDPSTPREREAQHRLTDIHHSIGVNSRAVRPATAPLVLVLVGVCFLSRSFPFCSSLEFSFLLDLQRYLIYSRSIFRVSHLCSLSVHCDTSLLHHNILSYSLVLSP